MLGLRYDRETARRVAADAIYRRAYALGLKGCTVYRPNAVTGTVLSAAPTVGRCCDLPGAD